MVRRTKAEAEATRHALLDAAERLFEARGVSRTSLQHIASAAGVTRGAVYWHFQDKADLFDAMMQRVKLPMAQAAAEFEACPGRDPLDRMQAMLTDTLQRIAQDAQVQRVFEIALHKVESVDDLRSERARRVQSVQAHIETIARCLEAAGIAPVHAVSVHAMLAGLIQTWLLDRQAFDLVAQGRMAIEGLIAGLTRPAAAAPSVPSRRRRP